MRVAIPGGRAQAQGVLPYKNVCDRGRPYRVKVLLSGLARAQRDVQGVKDGCLAGVERLRPLTLFLEIDQDFVCVGIGDIADRNDGGIDNPLLRQPVANRIDRRGTCKAHVYDRTPFKINTIVRAAILN